VLVSLARHGGLRTRIDRSRSSAAYRTSPHVARRWCLAAECTGLTASVRSQAVPGGPGLGPGPRSEPLQTRDRFVRRRQRPIPVRQRRFRARCVALHLMRGLECRSLRTEYKGTPHVRAGLKVAGCGHFGARPLMTRVNAAALCRDNIESIYAALCGEAKSSRGLARCAGRSPAITWAHTSARRPSFSSRLDDVDAVFPESRRAPRYQDGFRDRPAMMTAEGEASDSRRIRASNCSKASISRCFLRNPPIRAREHEGVSPRSRRTRVRASGTLRT